jgi:hypothetical protein
MGGLVRMVPLSVHVIGDGTIGGTGKLPGTAVQTFDIRSSEYSTK